MFRRQPHRESLIVTGRPTTSLPACLRLTSAIALAFTLLTLTGCGDGKIGRYPTHGKVLVDGKPIEGARVIFCPVGGSEDFQKERPFAVTDAGGEFSLTTFQKGDGAPAGEYNVMIRNGRPKSREEANRRSSGPRVARQYGKPLTSGVTVTVEKIENDLAPFELEAEKKKKRR